jgi:hypothetical protein
MASTVLLVGHEDDEHCDALERSLLNRGRVHVARHSLREMPSQNYSWSPSTGLRLDNQLVNAQAGIWRRPGSPNVSMYESRYGDFVERESRDGLVGGLLATTEKWITHPRLLWQAELKILQLKCAAALRIEYPDSLVTNDPKEAIEFADRHDRVIAKPVRYGLLSDDPQPLVVWTSRIDASRLPSLDGPPIILQREIEAIAHLRVVTVGSQTFIARLEAAALDWREHLPNHEKFERVQSHELPEVRQQASALAKSLKLGLSAQDWILAEEGPIFLEANPSGQWLFLDEAMDGTLCKAVVRKLERLALGG